MTSPGTRGEMTGYEPWKAWRYHRLRALDRQQVMSPGVTIGYEPRRDSRLRALERQQVTRNAKAVSDLGSRVQGLEFRIQDSGFRV